MMKILLSSMIISISIMMYFLNHPLSMGLMIMIQTLLICMISGMMINTYWFSYILFLTFMGGLLVLFIYVSSITSNELFSKSINLIYYMLLAMMILIMLILIYKNNNLKWLNFNNNYEMNEKFNIFYFFNNENKISLSKLYNNQTFMLMMILIIFLFITLVAVVKITNLFYGPLRSNFY